MRFYSLIAFIPLLLEFGLAYGFNDLSALFRRAITAPAPLSVIADGSWIGNDGPWSTFTFRIGNPAQDVRLLPSTASEQTLVEIPEGCPSRFMPDCETSRGWLYDKNKSTSWAEKGLFGVRLEQNLLAAGSGDFGFDSVGVNAQGQGGPTLDHQLLGGFAGNAFFLGVFGLNPRATNYSDFNNPVPSFMTNLKNNGSIPSLSFGYTAGARYRLKKVTGSLTLGGYDASRFTPNNLSFTFSSDSNRDLLVGLQSITTTDGNQKKTSLLPSPILTFVDSTLPYIYLPKEACTKFEQAFGLTWDDTSMLYLVNDTLHDELVSRNPSFTFTLGNSQSGGQTVDIVIPYLSFDLQATFPLISNSSRYFPLKRAANDSQYTLGRAFLQESYLIVDWERNNFSVSQCVFQDPNPQHLIAIPPVANTDTPVAPQGGSLSTGAIVAIAVAVVFVTLALIAVALAILFVKRRNKKRRDSETPKAAEEEQPQAPAPPPEIEEYRKPELDGASPHVRDMKPFHLDFGSGHTSVAMSHQGSVSKIDLATPASELSGPPILPDMPTRHELPAEEPTRSEFEDTSEGPRYKTAGERWRQRRAQGSYGSSNSGHDSHEDRPGLDRRLTELPAEEPLKPGTASVSAEAAAAPAAASSAPHGSEHPMAHPADDAPTTHRDGGISPPAVSPDPQRSARDPMEETLEGNVSPFSNTDLAPFFSPSRLQQQYQHGHGQREYEEPLITPLLAPEKEKEKELGI